MKLAMYQMENGGNMEQNLKKSLAAIEEAAKAGADLILFPEVDLEKSRQIRVRRPYTNLRRPEWYR